MYIPAHFEVNDKDELFSFIDKYAFGQLISQCHGRLFSTNIPFLLSPNKTKLVGHLARNNPQCAQLVGQEVLVTFAGPHHYVSPSWYSVSGVPTWNYQTVHVYGRCNIISEADAIRGVVDALAHKYEADFETPWVPDYPESLLRAIVAFNIEITEIQGQFKLSQNRSPEDQAHVREMLKCCGATPLAEAMSQIESVSD